MVRLQPFDHRSAAFGIGDIADAGDQRRRFLFRFPKSGFVPAADDDLIAFFGKAVCERKTDAGCAASDKNCVSCELQCRCPSK